MMALTKTLLRCAITDSLRISYLKFGLFFEKKMFLCNLFSGDVQSSEYVQPNTSNFLAGCPKMAHRIVPEAAKRAVFPKNSGFQKWWRWFSWNYLWDGKKYGLLCQDQYYYQNPVVKEAVRRLGIQEPWEYDQREMRIMRATNLAIKNEILPKEEWTKWEEETWYLQNYLNEIEEEQMQKANTTGFNPVFVEHHEMSIREWPIKQAQP